MESDDDGKDYNNTLYVFQNGACVSEWPEPPARMTLLRYCILVCIMQALGGHTQS
jgi:hypothetical protein